MSSRFMPLGLFISGLFAIAGQAQQTTYQATLNGSGVILNGMTSTSTATGSGTFVLNQPVGGPVMLDYQIYLPDFDVDGFQTPGDPTDNVTGVHLHDITQCIPGSACIPGDTAFTVHVMNIWGFPRAGDDDNDLVVDGPGHTLTGRWDDSDSDLSLMAPTLPISDPNVLSLLMNGQMALMVHTGAFPNAAIGGILHVVPEPTSLMWPVPLLWGLRRRWRSAA